MDKEIAALEKNNTWTLTRLPFGKIPIGCKGVYRIKYNPDGTIKRYKARLVLSCGQICFGSNSFGLGYGERVVFTSNGCKQCLFTWKLD